ncbi:MAG: hypothetical protein P4M10_01750, partial [Verrucomicrobiae bacterium]|nr:hypothetical protein [Verrucomicrobiae bacterium]
FFVTLLSKGNSSSKPIDFTGVRFIRPPRKRQVLLKIHFCPALHHARGTMKSGESKTASESQNHAKGKRRIFRPTLTVFVNNVQGFHYGNGMVFEQARRQVAIRV